MDFGLDEMAETGVFFGKLSDKYFVPIKANPKKMKQLNENWLTEGTIDYEYKRYILLAYLQEVGTQFKEHRLYPFFADLLNHYQNLIDFRHKKAMAENNFPKRISRIDFEKMKIEYESALSNEEILNEIESIVEFAIPEMMKNLNNGKEIYDQVESNLRIFPIGMIPLNTESGYMMLKENRKKDTWVYEFHMSIFENVSETFRAMKINFVGSYVYSISNGYESIKIDLIRSKKDLSNPATYAIESKSSFPLTETFLPIAKRSLMKFIVQGSS